MYIGGVGHNTQSIYTYILSLGGAKTCSQASVPEEGIFMNPGLTVCDNLPRSALICAVRGCDLQFCL